MKTLNVLPFVLLLMTACEPVTTVTRLSPNAYPAKPQDCNIQILTQAPTHRKYEEIAILSTVTVDGVGDKSLNAMLPSIRKTACEWGADAVLIKNVEPGSPSLQTSTGKAYTVAINFLD
jgi:hypothetical protein